MQIGCKVLVFRKKRGEGERFPFIYYIQHNSAYKLLGEKEHGLVSRIDLKRSISYMYEGQVH